MLPPCILGTHHEKGAHTFWAAVNRLPLSSNAVLCWKFCHVFHKLLRDGHPNVSTGRTQMSGKAATALVLLWFVFPPAGDQGLHEEQGRSG